LVNVQTPIMVAMMSTSALTQIISIKFMALVELVRWARMKVGWI
jgi:hypothetical protein